MKYTMVINVLVMQDLQEYKEFASKRLFLLVVAISNIAIKGNLAYVAQVAIELLVSVKSPLTVQLILIGMAFYANVISDTYNLLENAIPLQILPLFAL